MEKKFPSKNEKLPTLEDATLRIRELTKEIAADGKISNDEIDSLIGWLNANSEYKQEWPFNLLYQFLFEALQDGDISEQERSSLLSLIDSIQNVPFSNSPETNEPETDKPSSSSDSPKAKNEGSTKTSSSLFGRIISFFFPGPGELFQVESFSDPGQKYTVDLDKRICNCPDYVGQRRNFREGDLRRFCKHIIHAYFVSGRISSMPAIFQALLLERKEMGGGIPISDDFISVQCGDEPILLSKRDGCPWVNVFAPIRGPRNTQKYKRFGYNIQQKRWSYGNNPMNSEEIITQIHSHF